METLLGPKTAIENLKSPKNDRKLENREFSYFPGGGLPIFPGRRPGRSPINFRCSRGWLLLMGIPMRIPIPTRIQMGIPMGIPTGMLRHIYSNRLWPILAAYR